MATRTRARRKARADAIPAAPPSQGLPPIVELRSATVIYPGGHIGLERASLGVTRGEFTFLVGPTGCGKSTFIKTLIREVEPAEGQVLIAGRDIATLPAKRIPYLRRRVGTVFQDFRLLPNRTVYDNVAYALQVIGASRSEIRSMVPETLRLVGLSTKIHSYPDELSGGEQQRVSVARAFVNHPPLLLADEPTGNLDRASGHEIIELIEGMNRGGLTLVVVTHDPEVGRRARRILNLVDGRISSDAAPS
jgi:cell division transport system ATP-binding protein